MYAGALLKYLFFNSRKIAKKCMSSSHNVKTKGQHKALLHFAETSNITENSLLYKAVKMYNMFEDFGSLPVGIHQEQNKLFHNS